MKRTTLLRTLFVFLLIAVSATTWPLRAQPPTQASLKGVVTDPSGAFVPNALVVLIGPDSVQQRKHTDVTGKYAFTALTPGKYTLLVSAKGFMAFSREGVEVNGSTSLDVPLTITAASEVVNVDSKENKVTVDPASNSGALVLGEKELAALSDDPDELADELQAMAGPGTGPNGGQIYIDGFTGGNLPPKSSIREVRINSNPFSPEYDRPGFGRIEIFTKPGTDAIRGQVFFQFNNQDFNTRSPLLDSALPTYKQEFFGVNLSGPIIKQKASYTFDFERRAIDENASSWQPRSTLTSMSKPLIRRSSLRSGAPRSVPGSITPLMR